MSSPRTAVALMKAVKNPWRPSWKDAPEAEPRMRFAGEPVAGGADAAGRHSPPSAALQAPAARVAVRISGGRSCVDARP
jgi:hypothetical protein